MSKFESNQNSKSELNDRFEQLVREKQQAERDLREIQEQIKTLEKGK